MTDNWLMSLLIGALVVTPDLRFGGRVQSLLTTPRRGRLMAAALLTALGAGLVVALSSAAVSFAVGVPMLAGHGVDLGSAFADPVFWGRAATAVAAASLTAVAGAALGLLLHSLAATIIVFVGMLVVEVFGVALLNVPWFATAVDWSWLHATGTFSAGPARPDATMPFWVGGLVLLGWIAAVTVGAAARTFREDAT